MNLVLVGECNSKLAMNIGLQMDANKDAAFGILNRTISVEEDVDTSKGYIWTKVGDINICSCYISLEYTSKQIHGLPR